MFFGRPKILNKVYTVPKHCSVFFLDFSVNIQTLSVATLSFPLKPLQKHQRYFFHPSKQFPGLSNSVHSLIELSTVSKKKFTSFGRLQPELRPSRPNTLCLGQNPYHFTLLPLYISCQTLKFNSGCCESFQRPLLNLNYSNTEKAGVAIILQHPLCICKVCLQCFKVFYIYCTAIYSPGPTETQVKRVPGRKKRAQFSIFLQYLCTTNIGF